MRELKIFSGQANRPLAKAICNFLHLPLGEVTLGKFPDGENFCKIEEDIRGRDIFLIQPTCPPVNENLMELLIMIDSCKRASAARITAVIPYFGYARQDRKDEGRVPITAKLVANLITRAGADRVLAMDLHAAADSGLLRHPGRSPVRRPGAQRLRRAARTPARGDCVVVSPDVGSIKRAIGHAKRLGAALAIVDKRRDNALETPPGEPHRRIGRGQDRHHVRRHDHHRRLRSPARPTQAQANAGAKEIYVAVTHGVLLRQGHREGSKMPRSPASASPTPFPCRRRRASPKSKFSQRRPAPGRSHQAHPPRPIDQHPVR